METIEAYNVWAATYDTDNNFLQAIDSYMLRNTLLPAFITLLQTTNFQTSSSAPLTILDLGAGTGRASTLLLEATSASTTAAIAHSQIIALDPAINMLSLAQTKINSLPSNLSSRFTTEIYTIPSTTRPSRIPSSGANALISTLVLEHVDISAFLDTAASLLSKPNGILCLTNIHSEIMNENKAQASFRHANTGEKVLVGKSFVYSIEQVCDLATERGWIVEGVWERGIGLGEDGESFEQDVSRFGERARKWEGRKCWFGILMRFGEEERSGSGL